MKPIILALALVAAGPALVGGRSFDWDRYNARQDACSEADRIAAQCAQGVAFCDEVALRQAQPGLADMGPVICDPVTGSFAFGAPETAAKGR